jgi:hypothetical protein
MNMNSKNLDAVEAALEKDDFISYLRGKLVEAESGSRSAPRTRRMDETAPQPGNVFVYDWFVEHTSRGTIEKVKGETVESINSRFRKQKEQNIVVIQRIDTTKREIPSWTLQPNLGSQVDTHA